MAARDRDYLVARMLSRLGRPSDTNLSAILATEVQNVQEMTLENHEWYPWFLMSELESLVTEADEEVVDLPSDFLMESDEEDGALWIYDSTVAATENAYTLLTKDSDAFLRASQIGTGLPIAYSLTGNSLILKPTPDDVYALRFRYFASDTPLDAGGVTNNWLKYARDVLMYETMAQVASEILQNQAKGLEYATKATIAWQKLHSQHIARQEAGRDRQMGDD